METLCRLSYRGLNIYANISLKFVAGEGFEPPKRSATDLQSAPFGHSGNPPFCHSPYGKRPDKEYPTWQYQRKPEMKNVATLTTHARKRRKKPGKSAEKRGNANEN